MPKPAKLQAASGFPPFKPLPPKTEQLLRDKIRSLKTPHDWPSYRQIRPSEYPYAQEHPWQQDWDKTAFRRQLPRSGIDKWMDSAAMQYGTLATIGIAYAIIHSLKPLTSSPTERIQHYADRAGTSLNLLLNDNFETPNAYTFGGWPSGVSLDYLKNQGQFYSTSLSVKFANVPRPMDRGAYLEIPFPQPTKRYVSLFLQSLAYKPEFIHHGRIQIDFTYVANHITAGFEFDQITAMKPYTLLSSPAKIDLYAPNWTGILPTRWVTTIITVDLKQLLYAQLLLFDDMPATEKRFCHHYPRLQPSQPAFRLLLSNPWKNDCAFHMDNLIVAEWGEPFTEFTALDYPDDFWM